MEKIPRNPVRKTLSVLLAVLMIMGCVSTSFTTPAFANQAAIDLQNDSAVLQAISDFKAAMQTAENAGAFGATPQWSYTATPTSNPQNAGAHTVTITDNTDGALILKAAQAYDALLQTNLVAYNAAATTTNYLTVYPYTWVDQLYQVFAKQVLGYTGVKLSLMGAFNNVRQNGQALTAEGLIANGAYMSSGVGNVANNGTVSSTQTTVNSTELLALRAYSSYQDIADLRAGGGVPTIFVFGFNNSVIRNTVANRYNVFTSKRAPATTRSRALIDYLVTFNTLFFDTHHVGGASQTDPFTMSLTDVTTLVSAAASAWNNAMVGTNKFTTADIDRIFGTGTAAAVQAFMAACEKAKAFLNAEPDILYFMDEMGAASLGGSLFAGNHGFVAMVAAGDYTSKTKAQLDALKAEAQAHLTIINALSQDMQDLAVQVYGFDFAAVSNALVELYNYGEWTGLWELKAAIDADWAPYQAWLDKYTGEIPTGVPVDENDPIFEVYWAYEAYKEAYFADRNGDYEGIPETGFTDDEIIGYDAITAGYLASLSYYIGSLGQAAVDSVFTDGTDYAYDLRSRFAYEMMRRGMEGDASTANSLRNHYIWFNRIRVNDMSAKSTQELLDMVNEAATRRADFLAKQAAAFTTIDMPGGLTANSWEPMYNSFLPKIGDVITNLAEGTIGKLDATLIGRLTGWVDNALELYDGQGDEVTYENVVQFRRIFENLAADGITIWNYLKDADLLSDPIAAKLAAGMKTLLGTPSDPGILKKYLDFVGSQYATDKHNKKTPDYPVREGMDPVPPYADLARVLGQDYDVGDPPDGKKMDDVVEKLDTLLASPLFADLTGMDLKSCISGMAEGIYSDAVVNSVISALYPVVLSGLEEQLQLKESDGKLHDGVAL